MNDGAQAKPSVFVSYSRKDSTIVGRLVGALEASQVGAWVDWQDIPPSAEWWREVCAAIESSDALVFVVSPDSLSSKVCTEELAHAVRNNKRLVPIVCRDVEAVQEIAEPLRRINWIFLRPGDEFAAGVAKVVEAVATDLEWVRAHTRLVERSVEWAARGHDDSFLLQKNDLAEAERWLALGPDKEPRPTALQTEYIIASRAATTRRQRRLTAFAVVAGILIAAGAIAAILGFTRAEQRRQEAERNARDAVSRQVAAESRLDLGVDMGGALARAVLARQTKATFEAQSALFHAVHSAVGAARLLRAHGGTVWQTVFSPDGRRLATAGSDSTVMLWDVPTGAPVRRLSGHNGEISRIAFTPDGRRLASASADKMVMVWDVASGTVVHRLSGHEGVVVNLAISPDGRRIASVSDDDSVIVWDLESGARLHRLIGPLGLNALAFSPDGRRLATGGIGAVAMLWDVDSGKRLHRLAGHAKGFMSIVSVAFVNGGRLLATAASTDKDALLWDVRTGRQVARLRSHDAGIQGVAASPDGHRLVTGGKDNKVVIWDAKSGSLLRQISGHLTTELIYSVLAFGPDGRRLAGRTAADTVVLWDVESGKVLRQFRGHGKELLSGAVSPDGRWLATGGSDAAAILWSLTDSAPSIRIEGLEDGLARGSFSRDSRWLAVEHGDHAAVIDVTSGVRVRELAHGARVHSVAWSTDGKRIATGGKDKAAVVWDAQTGAVMRRFDDHGDSVIRVEFTGDGSSLITETYAGVTAVWNLETGQAQTQSDKVARWTPERMREAPLAREHRDTVMDIAYSDDGARFATASLDRTAILWDAATNAVVHRLVGHRDGVQCVAFSPDGRWVATGGRDDVANLWDAATGELVRRLAGHRGTVNEVAFSPDGHWVATVSDDASAILWDAASGKALLRFDGHSEGVAHVAFSPDGKRLLTSGFDGTLFLREIDLQALADRACRILDPGVSEADWKRITPDRTYPVSCRDLERLGAASLTR